MYERADSDCLWRLAGARTFFAGPLTYNAAHSHGAPVYLAGLYGSFRLRVGPAPWTSCRTAVIPAGISHELDLGGEPVAVLYVEPGAMGIEALSSLVRQRHEIGGALTGRAGEINSLREVWEDRTSLGWIDEALDDLVGFGQIQADRVLDLRVARSVERLLDAGARLLSVAETAADAKMSVSRFQHLFTRDMRVPFRRYRAWLRMRRAIQAIVAGESFTSAAYSAGFSDQAHFAHDFRKTFGAPASRSLGRIRRDALGARPMTPPAQ